MELEVEVEDAAVVVGSVNRAEPARRTTPIHRSQRLLPSRAHFELSPLPYRQLGTQKKLSPASRSGSISDDRLDPERGVGNRGRLCMHDICRKEGRGPYMITVSPVFATRMSSLFMLSSSAPTRSNSSVLNKTELGLAGVTPGLVRDCPGTRAARLDRNSR